MLCVPGLVPEESGVGLRLRAKNLLREGRSLVGTVGLFTDQDDAAVETLLTERFDGPASCEVGADYYYGYELPSSPSSSSGFEEQPQSSQNCIRVTPLRVGAIVVGSSWDNRSMARAESPERRRRRRYSTGVAELDEQIVQLVATTELTERDAELIAEIVTTALLLARDAASRLDLKIVNAALKEMRYAFKVFAPYRDKKKVSVFGSSRSKPGDPDHEQAKLFGKVVAERDWMVVTGAGPGSMEAANEGAGKAQSFGVNIRLPFEAEPNPVIAEDPKLINFKYFFTRKLMFIKEGSAFVLLPGGFGTMDEAFELLTLMQTGKSDMHPIVLLDPPGGNFWSDFVDFTRRNLVDRGYVSPTDLSLFKTTDDAAEAADEIERFYRNYDSMRFVGQRLVLRVRRVPDPSRLNELSDAFSDVLADGGIEPCDPLPAEVADNDTLDLERVCLYFDNASYGRLRELIDAINQS